MLPSILYGNDPDVCGTMTGLLQDRGVTIHTGAKVLAQIAAEKGCPVLGEFSCKGYDTFGPFKLVGGLAKGRPSEKDLEKARAFYRGLETT